MSGIYTGVCQLPWAWSHLFLPLPPFLPSTCWYSPGTGIVALNVAWETWLSRFLGHRSQLCSVLVCSCARDHRGRNPCCGFFFLTRNKIPIITMEVNHNNCSAIKIVTETASSENNNISTALQTCATVIDWIIEWIKAWSDERWGFIVLMCEIAERTDRAKILDTMTLVHGAYCPLLPCAPLYFPPSL